MADRIRFIGLLLSAILITAAAVLSYTAPAQQQTRVETDQATGAIRFIANGREEARIDKDGLHVRQSVQYGGTLTDVGEAFYDHKGEAAHAR